MELVGLSVFVTVFSAFCLKIGFSNIIFLFLVIMHKKTV